MRKFSIILTVVLFLIMFFALSFTIYAEDSEVNIVFRDGEYSACLDDEVILSSTNLETLIGALSAERISLDGIFISEPLSLGRSAVISGTFESSCDLRIERGASIILDDASITFTSDASIRICGGTLTLNDTYINATSTAIYVDNMDSSELTVNSGECTSSTAAVIEITRGTVNLFGGSFKSKAQTAVINRATLNIAGNAKIEGQAYQIKSARPIYSIDGSIPDDLTLMMENEFEQGRMCICIIDATDFTEGVRIFDCNGKEEAVKYFDSYRGIAQKNFISVYKPYKIDFISDGEKESVYALYGEKLDIRLLPDKTGYAPKGWYCEHTLNNIYDFSLPITSSFSLYAGYSLLPPTFSLKDCSKEYDTLPLKVGFSTLTHPLLDSGIILYKWYNSEDELMCEGANLILTEVSESGEYYCKVTFSHGRDTVEIKTPPLKATISKGVIMPPVISPLVYNAMPQYPLVPYSLLYTVNSQSAVDAGEYTLTLTLVDSENYKWDNTSESSIEISYEITCAENEWLHEISINDIYYGAELSLKAISKYGEAQYTYSSTENGVYSLTPPTAVGSYYVKAIVPGSTNYLALESKPVLFEIMAEKPIAISVMQEPNTTSYYAFDLFKCDGMTLSVLYNSGRRSTIDARLANFSYQSGSSFMYTDNAVIIEYMGCRALQPVTVSRIDYTHNVSIENIIATYDGLYHTATPDGKAVMGKDGIELSYRVVGGGIDAGEYQLKLEFFTESTNYNVPEPIFATLTVMPLSRNVVWCKDKFVYDGTFKSPEAYFVNEYGVQIPLTVYGGGIYAGNNYHACVASPSTNYTLENPECDFIIDKATYDMSAVSWNTRSYVYSGEELSVYLSNLPGGVSVIGYVGASGSSVGTYSARVSFAYDTANYYEPTLEPYSWSIEPREYDLSGFSFEGYSFVYDSFTHYPILNGEMPLGIDGIPLTYSYSGGVTSVSEGVRVIEVKFATVSENYCAPASIYVEIYATPQPIYVKWDNLTFTYTGNSYIPTATSELCEIEVSGGSIGAGKHTAIAKSLDPNYAVTNDECEFIILKAENAWESLPVCPNVYESSSPTPIAQAVFGEYEYKFYKDAELTAVAELPLTVGDYYCSIYVSEGDNYLSLYSEPIKFSVMAVMPVRLECILINSELYAFDLLDEEDVFISLHLNDGETRLLSLLDVTVSYGEYNSLRAGNESITFAYGELEFVLYVSVKKASFDLSDVVWSELNYTYDGTKKSPCLLNLPDGLTVKKYIGVGESEVGEYTINAVFDYDTDNYEMPILEDAKMIINAPEIYPDNGKNRDDEVYAIISVGALLLGLMVFAVVKRRKELIASFTDEKSVNKAHTRKVSTINDNVGSVLSVNAERADELISDSLARTLIRKNPLFFKTRGTRRAIVNVDTISEAYESGSIVDINSLKSKGIIGENVYYIKVLGRGTVDKPLKIYANSFSLNAIKMIALTGGEANKIQTKRLK